MSRVFCSVILPIKLIERLGSEQAGIVSPELLISLTDMAGGHDLPVLLPGKPETQTREKLNDVRQPVAVVPEQLHGGGLRVRVIVEVVRISTVPVQQAPQIVGRAEGTQVEMMAENVAQILKRFLHFRAGGVHTDQSGRTQDFFVAC